MQACGWLSPNRDRAPNYGPILVPGSGISGRIPLGRDPNVPLWAGCNAVMVELQAIIEFDDANRCAWAQRNVRKVRAQKMMQTIFREPPVIKFAMIGVVEWNSENKAPTRRNHTMQFSDSRLHIIDVFENLIAEHTVIGIVSDIRHGPYIGEDVGFITAAPPLVIFQSDVALTMRKVISVYAALQVGAVTFTDTQNCPRDRLAQVAKFGIHGCAERRRCPQPHEAAHRPQNGRSQCSSAPMVAGP